MPIQHACLAQDIIEIPTTCRPATPGYDAKRTDKIAPLLDLHVRPRVVGVEARQIDGKTLARGRPPDDDRLGLLRRRRNDLGQPHLVRRPHDVVEAGDRLERLHLGLRVAPDGGDAHIGVLSEDRADTAAALGSGL